MALDTQAAHAQESAEVDVSDPALIKLRDLIYLCFVNWVPPNAAPIPFPILIRM